MSFNVVIGEVFRVCAACEHDTMRNEIKGFLVFDLLKD